MKRNIWRSIVRQLISPHMQESKKKNKTDEYYPNWLYLYGHETIGLSVGAGNGHCPFRTLRTKITNELMYMKHEEANIYMRKKKETLMLIISASSLNRLGVRWRFNPLIWFGLSNGDGA